jgi:hypothetical protein
MATRITRTRVLRPLGEFKSDLHARPGEGRRDRIIPLAEDQIVDPVYQNSIRGGAADMKGT